MKGASLASLDGPLKPIAQAAVALATIVRGSQCKRLPLAAVEDAKSFVRAGQAQNEMREAQEELQKVCADLSGLKHKGVRVELRDAILSALAKDGKQVGTIRIEFETDEGRIELDQVRFLAIE